MISGIILIDTKTLEQKVLERILTALNDSCIYDSVLVLDHRHHGADPSNGFQVKSVVNDDNTSNQLNAIVRGYELLDQQNLHGVMVCPTSQPNISQSFLVDLLQGYWKLGKNIVVPHIHGGRNVPMVFDKSLVEEMKTDARSRTIDEFLTHHPDDIVEISLELERNAGT